MTSAIPNQSDCSPERPSRREALLYSALLSALFLVVYGSCNWITSKRSDIRVIQFEWEKFIPIVPWMIVPYMSIDVFFVAAPFLCRSRQELHVLAKRMATATVAAGICFLLVPLTLANQRPEMPGVFGAIHDLLKSGDKPYNLYPSLHVTYLLILWPHYRRLTRGILRLMLHAWFALVFCSVLFVFQHHFADMIGGAILAVTCCYVVPEKPSRTSMESFMPRPAIAMRYAIGAAAMLAIAWMSGSWGLVAAWIAVSLIIM